MKNIRRGEIYYADFPFAAGSEQSGLRPVIILQNDKGNTYSPTTIVAAITSSETKKPLPTHIKIRIGNSDRDSVVLLEQIRTIDKCRLKDYIGKVNKDIMGKIDNAIITSLGIKVMERILE